MALLTPTTFERVDQTFIIVTDKFLKILTLL
nr:MAG TPA: hypothetical protein [Caudoviricetes sp.]